MQLVYPPNPHQTYEKSTLMIGSVEPGSTLTVNQQSIPVSSQGFFAWKVELSPGTNQIQLKNTTPQGVEEIKDLSILRPSTLELSKLPSEEQELHPFVWPCKTLGLQPGETFYLVCPGPPQAKVICSINQLLTHPIELHPLSNPISNQEGIFAQLHQLQSPWPEGEVYVAAVQIPLNTPSLSNLTIQYQLEHANQRLTLSAQGKLTILQTDALLYANIQTPNAIARTHPDSGARKTPFLQGTYIAINGFYGDFCRVQLTPTQTCWVAKEDIELLHQPFYPPWVPIHLIQTQVDQEGFQVILPLDRLVPHEVCLEPDKVTLQLFGTISHCDFIHYAPPIFGQGLESIQWEQTDTQTVTITIHLASPLWGFQRVFDETQHRLICSIRTAKSVLSGDPFIIAIDPGHGGSETGSTAPDGTPEKDLNLSLALKLQQALQKLPKVKTILTRATDQMTGLEDRVETAMSEKAHLLLSLHHNALPDGRNPLGEKGVSTFYYYPFALPLARHLQDFLTVETDFEDYGILYDSLHMCRVMEMPALLLELGFLTHPEDAERCLSPQHQEKVIQALTKAIESVLTYEHTLPTHSYLHHPN